MGSREQPRGRRDRFIVIPFSSTCRSAASVDVVQSKKPQGAGGGEGASAGRPAKGESLSLVARLLRGFKNLSHQIFAVYDEEDEDEEEPEMVIGLPTDVKHVAHIGWDGSSQHQHHLQRPLLEPRRPSSWYHCSRRRVGVHLSLSLGLLFLGRSSTATGAASGAVRAAVRARHGRAGVCRHHSRIRSQHERCRHQRRRPAPPPLQLARGRSTSPSGA